MTGPRLWTLLLAAVSFLAGTAAGLLIAERDDAPQRSGWSGFAERFSDEFHLSAERAACLRVLLDQYEAELQSVRAEHQAATRESMEPELRRLAAEYEGYIRNRVLPPSQRDNYDRLARPLALVQSESY